ncbi:MAG: TetR/AcrR family transcriptional regulator [Galbitalea sp.]
MFSERGERWQTRRPRRRCAKARRENAPTSSPPRATDFWPTGFDGTSVDTIAATAGVSKRTVYDYFGDKQALLLAVLESSAASLMATIDSAIDEHLTTVADLEDSLVKFALRILSTTLTSSDYATLTRLVAAEAGHLPAFDSDHWMSSAPEEAIAARSPSSTASACSRPPIRGSPPITSSRWPSASRSTTNDSIPARAGRGSPSRSWTACAPSLRAYRPSPPRP